MSEQSARDIAVTQMTVDGGYTGLTAEQACEEHGMELRPTRLRGGKSSAEHWGWEEYTWEVDEEGQPVRITCPEGVSAPLEPGRGEQRYIARFDKATCGQCPYFKQGCRVESRVHKPYGFYVEERTAKVAQQRQQVRPEDRGIRAGVEATMRSLKHPLRGDKLPVRGLTRARMYLYGAALMVNLRRVHRYERKKQRKRLKKLSNAPKKGALLFFVLWVNSHSHSTLDFRQPEPPR